MPDLAAIIEEIEAAEAAYAKDQCAATWDAAASGEEKSND